MSLCSRWLLVYVARVECDRMHGIAMEPCVAYFVGVATHAELDFAIVCRQITSRIVNVSSISAGSTMHWDNLNQERGFSSHSSYSQVLPAPPPPLHTPPSPPRVGENGICSHRSGNVWGAAIGAEEPT